MVQNYADKTIFKYKLHNKFSSLELEYLYRCHPPLSYDANHIEGSRMTQ